MKNNQRPPLFANNPPEGVPVPQPTQSPSIPGLPVPPHASHPLHIPPHHDKKILASQLRIDYNAENALSETKAIFNGMTETVLRIIEERCPPEQKLTLALALSLPIDISQYPTNPSVVSPLIRFSNPFLTEEIISLICKYLPASAEKEKVRAIYEDAPPEISLLAIVLARFLDQQES